MSLIFVDVEAVGPCPSMGNMTEFGAVCFDSLKSFYGVVCKSQPSLENPAVPVLLETPKHENLVKVMKDFYLWLGKVSPDKHPTFVSDNPAFDWQWVNDAFHRAIGKNPFGFSARRIGDFYAGLCGDFWKSNKWKSLRRTPHDHNPVNDSLGNLEAFQAMLRGER